VGDKSREAVILEDFVEFQKAGLTYPLMQDIESGKIPPLSDRCGCNNGSDAPLVDMWPPIWSNISTNIATQGADHPRAQ